MKICVTDTQWILVLCIDTHVCMVTKFIVISKETKICLPNKEYLSIQRCKRINMAAKCKIYMNCSKT